ncbi:hypothetical protein Tco_0425864 [Tanacetum coccineum]
MRTRSSSNLVGESSPNPTTSNPKRRNRRRSKQPFSLEESPVDTMADQFFGRPQFWFLLRGTEEFWLSAVLKNHVGVVLLGQEPRHNVPDWCLRLVNDRVGWNLYPWGSYVWPSLYYSLRNANVRQWPSLYATLVEQEEKTPKYILSGFTWAFKTWILESYPVRAREFFTRLDRYPRVVAWLSDGRELYLFEDLHQMQLRLDQNDGFLAGDSLMGSPQGGLTMFTTPASTFFFEVAEATPMSSRYPPSHSVTPNIMTPMQQQGFAPWSSPYQTTVDVGGVLPNAMNLERKVVRPSMYFQSPYANLPDTTVAPKKQPEKNKNKARNGKARDL